MDIKFAIGDVVEVKKGKSKGKTFEIDCISIWKDGVALYDTLDFRCWQEEADRIPIKPVLPGKNKPLKTIL